MLGGRTSSLSVMHLVPFKLYAKQGEFVGVEEALATQYVSENTTIPVPRMLDVIDLGSGRGNFLLMTSVKGREYGPTGVTLDQMPEDQRAVFIETLRGWFEQLRRLPPPGDHTISGFMGTGVLSYRINHSGAVGPFVSQVEFHAQSFCQPWEPYDDALRAALDKRAKTRYKICFTHGDISPYNILVDKELRPCALIDWEYAVWMPEGTGNIPDHFIFVNDTWNGRKCSDIFPHYEAELTVERAI